MTEKTLFRIDTPYRREVPVTGKLFGNPDKKTIAIVGALRGNEVQQMYICARIVKLLSELETENKINPECGILVIPCVNQFSMNVGRRFWAADNTDINRMFPGYSEGETTQRIAAGLFDAIQEYEYGVHMTSLNLRGDCTHNVRIMETGYNDARKAYDFGLPYVVLRTPQPYDTTTLNYNWQIWETKAFSLYSGGTPVIKEAEAVRCCMAVMRFMSRNGIIYEQIEDDCTNPKLIRESSLRNILTSCGGIFIRKKQLGERVSAGETVAVVMNPLTGETAEELRAPADGIVFFLYREDLISGHAIAGRVLPDE